MLKLTVMAAVVALNLSYVAKLEANDYAYRGDHCGFYNNNPIGRCDPMGSLPKGESFDTPKAPIPYIGYWQNEISQTAQQMIAICSILETEADIYCLVDE